MRNQKRNQKQNQNRNQKKNWNQKINRRKKKFFRSFKETQELEKGYLTEPLTERLPPKIVAQARPYQCRHKPPKLKPTERFYQATYNGQLLSNIFVSQYGNIIRRHEDGKVFFVALTKLSKKEPYYSQIGNGLTIDGKTISKMRVHKLVAETWLRKPQYHGYEFYSQAEYLDCVDLLTQLERLTLTDEVLIRKRDGYIKALRNVIQSRETGTHREYYELDVHHLLPKTDPVYQDFNYAVNLAWTYMKIHNSVTDRTKKFQVIEPDGSKKEFRTVALLAEYFKVCEGAIVDLLENEPPEIGQSEKYYITLLPMRSSPKNIVPDGWIEVGFLWILDRPMKKKVISSTRSLIVNATKWIDSVERQLNGDSEVAGGQKI